jgi:hypothetical protein
MKFARTFCVVLLGATLAGCAIMAATATDPESKRQWTQAEADWEEFGQRLSAANAAYAAGLAQSPPVQVQPMTQAPQQTFCNQLGNTITCNGPSGQTFCNRIGNTTTCQ